MRDRLGKIRMLAMDADGVLTDGGLYVGGDARLADAERIAVRFDVKDGHGIKALSGQGVYIAVISGRAENAALAFRCRQLGVDFYAGGVADKVACAEELLKARQISFGELAYIGDDIPDIPLLRRAGVSAAPADAVAAVRDICDWISGREGGRGAVRELCDLVIESKQD